MLLVFLYSLSEFGAVQLLGYDTLTRVVYATRLLDRATSFAAATVLLVLALVGRRHRAAAARRHAGAVGHRPPVRRNRPIPLGAWRVPAPAVGGRRLVFVALAVPVAGARAVGVAGHRSASGSPLRALGDELADLARPAWTTAWLGVGRRHAGRRRSCCRRRCSPPATAAGSAASPTWRWWAGSPCPGVVIALSLAFWSLNVPPFDRLYQTISAADRRPTSCTSVRRPCGPPRSPSPPCPIGCASRRSCSAHRAPRRARTVELPLMRPGLLAGGGLVLLSTVKELPATLLLAPIGLETLTTTVWSSFEDGFLAEAGLARSCWWRSPACSPGCSCCAAPTISHDRSMPRDRRSALSALPPAPSLRSPWASRWSALGHAWATPTDRVTADEPQYLLTALSLGAGRRPRHRRRDRGRGAIRRSTPSTSAPGRPAGRRRSAAQPHDPLLPVLLAAAGRRRRLGRGQGRRSPSLAGALAAAHGLDRRRPPRRGSALAGRSSSSARSRPRRRWRPTRPRSTPRCPPRWR